jgi:serine/threonine protein kinase
MAPDVLFTPFDVYLELMAKVDFDASSSELVGTEIGPYRLVRRLGMGGMAETFVAIRRGPGGFSQRVCLKLVLPFFREDEEFVSLFQREARLAAKLRHSNIVGVIDFGEIAGRSYMALELVDGVDLQVLLEAESGKRLSPELVALVGHDLASALDHAHNPPRESDFDGSYGGSIVHRDISPSNVLVSRHGEIMLTDFGVAKAVTGSSRKHSAVKGKIPYMSPEQLRLESLDGRADLFGVGVVLFEALCGQRPYEGGHDPATIMLILQGTHQPLASLAPGAPPGLCKLIDSLIEPDREKRPESAAALIELLDPFVPSPRIRRQLGKRIAELRPEEDVISGYPPAFGEQDTAQHGDVDNEERKKRTSGIVGAGESQKHLEPWEEGIVPEAGGAADVPQRSGRRTLAASLITLVLLAAGSLAWWSSQGGSEEVPRARMESGAEAEPVSPALQVVQDPNGEAAVVDVVDSKATAGAIEKNEGPKVASPKGLADGNRSAIGSISEAKRTEASVTRKPKRASSPATLPPAKLTVVVYPWGDVWINGKSRGPAPLKNVSLKPGRYRISAGQGEQTVTQTIRLRSGEQKKVKLKLDVTK